LPQRSIFGCWLPVCGGDDWQAGQRADKECQMHNGLSTRSKKSGQQVGIEVSGQEDQLEEQHAGCPDGGTTAEPWQNESPGEWLDLEEQKSADEDGESVSEHGGPSCEEPRTIMWFRAQNGQTGHAAAGIPKKIRLKAPDFPGISRPDRISLVIPAAMRA